VSVFLRLRSAISSIIYSDESKTIFGLLQKLRRRNVPGFSLGDGFSMMLESNIFNRREFELYDPRIVIEPPFPCDFFCRPVSRAGPDCINEITVERVFQAVMRILDARRT
jgi:hypothetical protein